MGLVLAGGVVVVDAHLFEFSRGDDLAVQHLPDEEVSRLLYLAEVLVLLDFQVEQRDFALLGHRIHSAEVPQSGERHHCFLQDRLYLCLYLNQDGCHLLSGVLAVQD